MKYLILLRTKDIHFTFNNIIHKQVDGVVIGLPSGPVLVGIFMVELLQKLFPTLNNRINNWRRYVDGTICFIGNGYLDFVLPVLNSFHPQIQFTHQKEIDPKITSSDVLLIRNDPKLLTKVYRKLTNANIFIHWNSFALIRWKRSTLNMLISRA